MSALTALVWLNRFGGGRDLANDPVCGMQICTADAPARARHAGADYWFCSDGCRERFLAEPSRFTGGGAWEKARGGGGDSPTGAGPGAGRSRRGPGHDLR